MMMMMKSVIKNSEMFKSQRSVFLCVCRSQ